MYRRLEENTHATLRLGLLDPTGDLEVVSARAALDLYCLQKVQAQVGL